MKKGGGGKGEGRGRQHDGRDRVSRDRCLGKKRERRKGKGRGSPNAFDVLLCREWRLPRGGRGKKGGGGENEKASTGRPYSAGRSPNDVRRKKEGTTGKVGESELSLSIKTTNEDW